MAKNGLKFWEMETLKNSIETLQKFSLLVSLGNVLQYYEWKKKALAIIYSIIIMESL